MAPNQSKFQIYGRTSYEEPLTFVKEIAIVQPATEAMIIEQSLATVGNTVGNTVGRDEWIEVIALPSTSLVHVTGADTTAAGEEENG